MVSISLDMGAVNVIIELLKIPLLVLGIVILFRANRMMTIAEDSLESLEKTAENVESSSRTLGDLLKVFKTGKGDGS